MNIFGVGPLEVMIIVVVALIFIGPAELPTLARQLGRAIYEFRRASAELTEAFAQQYAEEVAARETAANPEAALEPAVVTADGQAVEMSESVESGEFVPEAGYTFTPAANDVTVATEPADTTLTTQHVSSFEETPSESNVVAEESAEESDAAVASASEEIAPTEAVATQTSSAVDPVVAESRSEESVEWPLARAVAANDGTPAADSNDASEEVPSDRTETSAAEMPADAETAVAAQESPNGLAADVLRDTVIVESASEKASNGGATIEALPSSSVASTGSVDVSATPLNGTGGDAKPRRRSRKKAPEAAVEDASAATDQATAVSEEVGEAAVVAAPTRRRRREAKTEQIRTEEVVTSQPHVAMTESKE